MLFNPFGTDARVEVTLRTNEAVPEVLQKIDVPRRMRVLVPIHEQAVRKPQVAVSAHATVGRVVAVAVDGVRYRVRLHRAHAEPGRGEARAVVDARLRRVDAPTRAPSSRS